MSHANGEVNTVKMYLTEIREKKRLSTRELAARSGVSRSHIQRIEAGEANPTIETMCKLAKALEVSVHDLFSCE